MGHFRISLNLFLKKSLSAYPFIWKWDFIHLQIKLIFIWMVVRQASLWSKGLGELGNGLFCYVIKTTERQLVLTVEIHFLFTEVLQLSLQRQLLHNICSEHF